MPLSEKEFLTAFEHDREYLFRTALGITRNWHDAEDLLQQATMKALVRLPDYNDDNFQGWMYTIVVNTGINWKRNNYNTVRGKHLTDSLDADLPYGGTYADLLVSPEPSALQRVIEAERIIVGQKALQELSPRYQDAVRLMVDEEQTTKQMEQTLNLNESGVKSLVLRARRAFAERLPLEITDVRGRESALGAVHETLAPAHKRLGVKRSLTPRHG